jgi:hypothetical protein
MNIEFKINDNTDKVLKLFDELRGVKEYKVYNRYILNSKDIEGYGVADIENRLSFTIDDLGKIKELTELISTVIDIYSPLVNMVITPCNRKIFTDDTEDKFRVEFKFSQFS